MLVTEGRSPWRYHCWHGNTSPLTICWDLNKRCDCIMIIFVFFFLYKRFQMFLFCFIFIFFLTWRWILLVYHLHCLYRCYWEYWGEKSPSQQRGERWQSFWKWSLLSISHMSFIYQSKSCFWFSSSQEEYHSNSTTARGLSLLLRIKIN